MNWRLPWRNSGGLMQLVPCRWMTHVAKKAAMNELVELVKQTIRATLRASRP